jgi:Protein of unknown function (DUF3604)
MKTRVVATSALVLVLFSIGILTSCYKSKAPEPAQQAGGTAPAQTEERVEKNPDRNAYFGEEHIHTSWSMDAWLMGNRITDPDDALKYAQGQTIKHPMGYDITIDTPMDFMGVTDHSEYVGITAEANTSGSAVSKMRITIGTVHRWGWGQKILRLAGAVVAMGGVFFMWKAFSA